MNSFALLSDPVRRRIIEVLSTGTRSAGEVTEAIHAEFGISQPAVSHHLKVLREADAVAVRADGARRLYEIAPGGLDDVRSWVDRYARLWPQRLDALETELARGRRAAEADSRTRPDRRTPDEGAL